MTDPEIMQAERVILLLARIARAKAMLREALMSEYLTDYSESRVRAALLILEGPRQ